MPWAMWYLKTMARRTIAPLVAKLRHQHSGKPVEFTPIELEAMRRLMEQELPQNVRKGMGLSQHSWDKMLARQEFQTEYERQCNEADRSLRSRLERLATEALEVVRDVMRNSISPATKLRAATEILDRSGYVKVEKRVNLNMDAEAVIRELNRLGTTGAIREALDVTDALDALETSDAPSDAEILEALTPPPEPAPPIFELPRDEPRVRAPRPRTHVEDGDAILPEGFDDFAKVAAQITKREKTAASASTRSSAEGWEETPISL